MTTIDPATILVRKEETFNSSNLTILVLELRVTLSVDNTESKAVILKSGICNNRDGLGT